MEVFASPQRREVGRRLAGIVLLERAPALTAATDR